MNKSLCAFCVKRMEIPRAAAPQPTYSRSSAVVPSPSASPFSLPLSNDKGFFLIPVTCAPTHKHKDLTKSQLMIDSFKSNTINARRKKVEQGATCLGEPTDNEGSRYLAHELVLSLKAYWTTSLSRICYGIVTSSKSGAKMAATPSPPSPSRSPRPPSQT